MKGSAKDLPEGIRLRAATAADGPRIRSLIFRVGINPTGLDWRRFTLAVDSRDRLIGCGQVKPHQDGSLELASIAVRPAWRKRGVASAVVSSLQAQTPPPLWLTCRRGLAKFYDRFGFEEVQDPESLPRYFQKLLRLARLGKWFGPRGGLMVMVWR